MTRSLTPPRLRGQNLTYSCGPGTCVGLIIKPRHTTRQPPSCNVLCSVPRTGIACSNGHVRVPARTHARRKDADCPPVMRTYHHFAILLLHAPHRGTWTRHVLASTKACGLRSAVHAPTLLPPHCTCIALHQKSTPHSSARTGWQGPTQTSPEQLLELCLDESITYASLFPALPARNQQQLSADRCLAKSRYIARGESHDQVSDRSRPTQVQQLQSLLELSTRSESCQRQFQKLATCSHNSSCSTSPRLSCARSTILLMIRCNPPALGPRHGRSLPQVQNARNILLSRVSGMPALLQLGAVVPRQILAKIADILFVNRTTLSG
jgi:hypothetical protein